MVEVGAAVLKLQHARVVAMEFGGVEADGEGLGLQRHHVRLRVVGSHVDVALDGPERPRRLVEARAVFCLGEGVGCVDVESGMVCVCERMRSFPSSQLKRDNRRLVRPKSKSNVLYTYQAGSVPLPEM